MPGHHRGGNVAGMKFFLAGLVVLAILVLIAVRLLRGRISIEPKTACESCPAAGVPTRKSSEIDALSITLEIDKKTALYLMLAADGTINRMGSGTREDRGGHLLIGKIESEIFKEVRAQVNDAMLASLGQGFGHQNPRGALCRLSLTFQFKDGISNGLGFEYGSESGGAPTDIAEYVTTAVRRTDAWYENFKRNAAKEQQS